MSLTFGARAAQRRCAREEAQATAADYETAKLSLEAELGLDYFEFAQRRRSEAASRQYGKAYADNLQLTAVASKEA